MKLLCFLYHVIILGKLVGGGGDGGARHSLTSMLHKSEVISLLRVSMRLESSYRDTLKNSHRKANMSMMFLKTVLHGG